MQRPIRLKEWNNPDSDIELKRDLEILCWTEWRKAMKPKGRKTGIDLVKSLITRRTQ